MVGGGHVQQYDFRFMDYADSIFMGNFNRLTDFHIFIFCSAFDRKQLGFSTVTSIPCRRFVVIFILLLSGFQLPWQQQWTGLGSIWLAGTDHHDQYNFMRGIPHRIPFKTAEFKKSNRLRRCVLLNKSNTAVTKLIQSFFFHWIMPTTRQHHDLMWHRQMCHDRLAQFKRSPVIFGRLSQ